MWKLCASQKVLFADETGWWDKLEDVAHHTLGTLCWSLGVICCEKMRSFCCNWKCKESNYFYTEHVKYTVTANTRSACLYEADSAQQLAILEPQLAQPYCYYWTVNSWPAWDYPQIIVTTELWTVGQPETILSLFLPLNCERLASLRPSLAYCYYGAVNGWQDWLL